MLGKLSRRSRKRLETSGRRANATVLAVSDRAMTITTGGGNLVTDTEVAVKVTLRVEPDGEPAFEVQEKFRFPQLALPSAGQRVAVVYDPDDHDTIMIDGDPLAAVDAMLSRSGRPPEKIDLVKDLMASAMSGAPSADTQAIATRWAAQHGGAVVIAPGAMDGTTFAGAPGVPPAASTEQDPVALLSQLASLKDRGLLSDAEFAAQKARVLAG